MNFNAKMYITYWHILCYLCSVGITLITFICNAILRTHSLPIQWKIPQVNMVLKPGKPPELAILYRPISLLPILSEVFEALLLRVLNPLLIAKYIFQTINLDLDSIILQLSSWIGCMQLQVRPKRRRNIVLLFF